MADLNRRTVLAGAAGVTTSCLPLVTAAGAQRVALTPIQALWPQYLACLAEAERLSDAVSAAWHRQVAQTPPVPEDLRLWMTRTVSPTEIRYYGLDKHIRSFRRIGAGREPDGFQWMTAKGWRAFLALPPDPDMCPEIEDGWRRYAREQLALAEQWEAEAEAISISTGCKAASEASETACERLSELQQQIMATPAATIADLHCQSEIVSRTDFFVEELVASIQALAEGGANA